MWTYWQAHPLSSNDISVHPAKRLVTLADGTAFPYGSADTQLTRNAVRRTIVLRAPPTSTTVWLGEFVEICLTPDAPSDSMSWNPVWMHTVCASVKCHMPGLTLE